MRVLMVAPPGAGRGTQGALIAAHFGIPHIATGELLRDHVARRTDLGVAVQGFLDRGDLVPDQVVLDMVREAVVAARAAGGGYVLDGVPRNMEQARALYLIAVELGMTADVALHLEVGDAEVTRRLLARAALEHRTDDTVQVIAQRLALYHQVTAPILVLVPRPPDPGLGRRDAPGAAGQPRDPHRPGPAPPAPGRRARAGRAPR